MKLTLLSLILALTAGHYGDPNKHGCMADEKSITITGLGGDICSPPCDASGACPTDVPSGVTATPTCALHDPAGNQFCALVCTPAVGDAQCGEHASCKATGSSATPPPPGLCTFDDAPKPPASAHWAPVPSPTFEEQGVCLDVGFEKDGKVGYAGAGSNGVGAQIIKSTDAGVTWKAVYPPPGNVSFNIFLATIVRDPKSAVVSGAIFQAHTDDGQAFQVSKNALLAPAQDAQLLPNGNFALVTQTLTGKNGVATSKDGERWQFTDSAYSLLTAPSL